MIGANPQGFLRTHKHADLLVLFVPQEADVPCTHVQQYENLIEVGGNIQYDDTCPSFFPLLRRFDETEHLCAPAQAQRTHDVS